MSDEEVKKISLLLYISHRSTALTPSPSTHINAEVVLTASCWQPEETPVESKTQDRRQHESVVAREPSAGGHSTAGSARSQEAGQSWHCPFRGVLLSHPGTYLRLSGTVPRTRMTRSWARGVLGKCKPLPPPGMRRGQYICPRVIQVENLVRCSSCVSIFQG